MPTSFVSNFTTGRPYIEPTETIKSPFGNGGGINIPNFRLPNDEPTDEPVNEPNEKNPTEEPPVEDVPWWEKVGKDIENSGPAKEIEQGGEDVIEGVARSPIGRSVGQIEQGASKVLSRDQFEKLGGSIEDIGKSALPELENVGTGIAAGEAEMAPIEGATIAIGGGPEDPVTDIGAGAEAVGAGIGGALSRFF